MTPVPNADMSSGALVVRSPTLPAFALFTQDLDGLRTLIDEATGGSALARADLDRIKIPTGGTTSFAVTTPAGEETVRELLGVILHLQHRRQYWSAPFSGSGVAPDCAADDGVVGVGDPGGLCAACPLSRFQGDERPACRRTAEVLLLEPSNLLPTIFSAAPTSVRPLDQYKIRLLNKGLSLADVITRITLERTTTAAGLAYARAVYTMVAPLDAEQRRHVHALRTMLAVGQASTPPTAPVTAVPPEHATRAPGEDDLADDLPDEPTAEELAAVGAVPPPGNDDIPF